MSGSVFAQGSLSGSWSTDPLGLFNLTEEGTLDWMHIGASDEDAPLVNHKSDVTPMLTFEVVQNVTGPDSGTGVYGYDDKSSEEFSWTDAPTEANASVVVDGIWIPGVTNAFRITAVAGTDERTLTLYLGSWTSYPDLSAKLRTSAPELDQTEYNDNYGIVQKFVLTYKAQA